MQSRICKTVWCSVAVNPQGTSVIENTMCTNLTPAIEEDATSGETNICKNFINNMHLYICQKWKVAE